MILSDFIRTLAMSDEDLLAFMCNTKLGESSDMAKCRAISGNILLLSTLNYFFLKSVAELRINKQMEEITAII